MKTGFLKESKIINEREKMKYYFLFIACLVSLGTWAQDDDLLGELDELEGETTEYTYGTFKSTRVINAQSVELSPKGELTLMISHRFGTVNEGAYALWGLDNASMRFGLAYGVTDYLSLNLGRSSFGKTYDGYAKVKLLRQSKGARNMPIGLVWYSGMTIRTIEKSTDAKEIAFASRLSYYNQLLIARKFNKHFSLQLMPTHIHNNVVATPDDVNDLFAVGIATRVKVSNRIALTGEYFYAFPNHTIDQRDNSLSLGVEIETGGHVFQLQFTNSQGMTENYFIGDTQGTWADGNIYFGFNVSRVFKIAK